MSTTEVQTQLDTPWWHRATAYQIYPRSFQDSNGDGIGDIPGILQRLDYLYELGVDVIWLSPVYQSPLKDNGYDISNYQALDPRFGTLDDLDALLRAVHGRGMKLVMDLVVNHTSDQHEWFQSSKSSTSSDKRDWYIWRPPVIDDDGNRHPPSNWRSFFSGPAWEWDESTKEYYLHLFDASQPDLNWENPDVRRAIYSMMNWWLERGVDGFRMDVINLISKPGEFHDGPIGTDGLGDGFHQYAFGPRLHEYLQEMRREVWADRDDIFTIGEMPGATPHQAILTTAPDRKELGMIFQFEHVDVDHGSGGKFESVPLDRRKMIDSLFRWQREVNGQGWNSLYLNNHDQPRLISRFGDEAHWYTSGTALATVLHCLRGTPFVFQGEEIGMTNPRFQRVEQYRDVETLNALQESGITAESRLSVPGRISTMSRDNARTPMQWDDGPHAGFSSGQPWIEVNPNKDVVNAQRQLDDPLSLYAWYKNLIRLRHELPVLAEGTFMEIVTGDPLLICYERRLNNTVLTVIANLQSRTAQALASVPNNAETLLSNVTKPSTGQFQPWEARVLIETLEVEEEK